MTGIKDIAREANVSVSTVRRALDNLPDVNKETKKKVLEIADRLAYQKNLLASSLVLKRTYIIGVIIPDVDISFYPTVVAGIERIAKNAEYRLLLYHSHNTLEGLIEGIKTFAGYKAAGMIISPVPGSEKDKIISHIKNIKTPCVFIDEYFDDADISYVSTDDVAGACDAVGYLAGAGHKRIALLTGNLEDKTGMNRVQGYNTGLSKAGIAFNDNLVIEAGVTREDGEKAAERILGLDERPDAVLCYNDAVAVGAMKVFLGRGLRIPEDISVMGYASLDYMDMLAVPLTTVFQPAREIGEKAAQILIDEIEGREHVIQKVLLDTELVIRESCKRNKT